MSEKTKEQQLNELEAYRQRLESDIRRSRNLQPDALNNNTPLIRNHQRVMEQIKELKK